MCINEAYYKKNFKVSTDNITFYNVKNTENITVYGLYNKENDLFKRLPDNVGANVNWNVSKLYTNPSGGRIRFKTDSKTLVVKGIFPNITNRSIISMLNSVGFDVYIMRDGKEIYHTSITPPIDLSDTYEKSIEIGSGMKEVTIYMPLYNDVKDVYIGLDKDAKILSHRKYVHEKPILYYGSSITQGASVSRPGMTYEAILSRALDTNFVNLGFAGSARGEDSIADYMSTMDFSAFVCDYDYNAPSAEHLKNTHKKLYQKIRATHKNVPYIMISKPILLYSSVNEDNKKRRQIILDTYNYAKENKDSNVYFIDGFEIFKGYEYGDCCADRIHPNDLGAMIIAKEIKKYLADYIK